MLPEIPLQIMWWWTVRNPPAVNAGPDQIACPGIPVSIGGNPTATGNSPFSYVWSPSTDLSSSTSSNPQAFNTVNKTYTVTVTDNHGCTNTDNVTINRHALAAINTPDVVICPGTSKTIGGNPTATGTAPLTYSWSPISYLNDPTSPNPVMTPPSIIQIIPTITYTYTVSVTDGNGCVNTANQLVTVEPPFTDPGTDHNLCFGQSTSIGGTPVASGGLAPYTYQWSPPLYLDDPTLENPISTPTSNVQYSVVVTDANNCNSAPLTIDRCKCECDTISG